MRKIKTLLLVALLASSLPLLAACRTNAETGSLIGAGAGALGGYMIGNEMDKDDDYGHHHHYRY